MPYWLTHKRNTVAFIDGKNKILLKTNNLFCVEDNLFFRSFKILEI